MRCESLTHRGVPCKNPAVWRVGVGTRKTDRQASCGKHLAFTCAAMYNAEERDGATLTLERITPHGCRSRYVTRTGKVLTDADIGRLADEAERGYDVSRLQPRTTGGGMFCKTCGQSVRVSAGPTSYGGWVHVDSRFDTHRVVLTGNPESGDGGEP